MFHILPFPGQAYPGNYANHHDIRAYLGHAKLVKRELSPGGYNKPKVSYMTLESKKLPMDFTESGVWVPLVDGRSAMLYCAPGNPSDAGMRRKSSAHRCRVICPDCGAHVPAGRTHQHKCK